MSDRKIPITASEIYSVIHDTGFLGSVSKRVTETVKAIGYLQSVCSVIAGAELARAVGIPCIVESDSGTQNKSSYSQYVLLQKVPGNPKQFEQNQEFQAIVHTSEGDLLLAVPTSNDLTLHPTLTPGSIQFK